MRFVDGEYTWTNSLNLEPGISDLHSFKCRIGWTRKFAAPFWLLLCAGNGEGNCSKKNEKEFHPAILKPNLRPLILKPAG